MSDNNKLIEKIKKLQEKAESLKEVGNLEEANVFFEKVQLLLLENSFNLEDILNYKTKEEIEYLKGKENGIEFFHNIYEGPYWEPLLMDSIAKNNNCYSYKTFYNNQVFMAKNNYFPYITLVGKKNDKEIVKYFYEIAKKLLRDLAPISYQEKVKELREEYKVIAKDGMEAYYKLLEKLTYDYDELISSILGITLRGMEVKNLIIELKLLSYEKRKNLFMPKSYSEKDLIDYQEWYIKDLISLKLISNRNTYIQSFLLGAADGVRDVLKHKKEEFVENLDKDKKEKVNALILQSKNELEKFIEFNIGKLNSSNAYMGDNKAWKEGYEKGRNLNLSKGINKDNGSFIKEIGN